MAYADYKDLVDLTEELLGALAEHVCGSKKFSVPQFDIEHKKVTKNAQDGDNTPV